MNQKWNNSLLDEQKSLHKNIDATEVLNINNKEAYSVAFGHMLVFINQEITEQDITEVVALKPREVIIDERGFKTDNDKMNAVIRLEAAGVEKISTI